MIDGLIACVFAARNKAHLEHWNTKSYAEHVALGDFYENVISLLDSFVECYQGRFGLVGKVKLIPYNQDIKAILKEDSQWMMDNCKDICKGVSALQNLLDNIVDLYLTTLYKLENLN